MSVNMWSLVLQADFVVKGVLIILLLFSVISWAIIFFKWRYFARARKENAIFVKNFTTGREPKSLYHSSRVYTVGPIVSVYKSVFAEGYQSRDDIKRSLKRFVALESAKLERYLNFLATTGSTTPFLGLFGTVWGLMHAFTGIGAAGSASLAVVAPGIAEALTTTAAGLIAAIPAVIGYNYYLSTARRLMIEMQDFAEELFDYFSGNLQ